MLFGILVAFAGDAAFIMATKRAFGVAPIRPPFLTARVIADGPGDAYLQANCPSSGFIVCRFINRLPISNSDIFLWSPDPARGGVFTPADPEIRRALSAEQFRFVVAVLRYDPIGELSAMARNTVDESLRVSVLDFNLNSQDKNEFQQELPPRYLAVAERTRSWRDTMPLALMSAIILIVLLLSGAYLVWALLLRGHRSADDNHLKRLAVIVILGILVNAFVCGAMSEPVRPLSSTRGMADSDSLRECCFSKDLGNSQTRVQRMPYIETRRLSRQAVTSAPSGAVAGEISARSDQRN